MREIFKVISACMLLLFTTISASSNPLNVLQNPGFEQGHYPPLGWDSWSGTNAVLPEYCVKGTSVGADSAMSGLKAVSLTLHGNHIRWGGLSQTFLCRGTTRFNASIYVKSKKRVTKGSTQAFIEVKFYDEKGQEIRKVRSSSRAKSRSWAKLKIGGKVPRKACSTVFSLVLAGGENAEGGVFFDNAFLSLK